MYAYLCMCKCVHALLIEYKCIMRMKFTTLLLCVFVCVCVCVIEAQEMGFVCTVGHIKIAIAQIIRVKMTYSLRLLSFYCDCMEY